MLLSTIVAKYYVAILMSVTMPNVPPQGWVHMLNAFDTYEECNASLEADRYGYTIVTLQTFKSIIKTVDMMECLTIPDIKELNEDLGHLSRGVEA